MTAVAGRFWGWVRPALSYRPWGSGKPDPDCEEPAKGGWSWLGVTTWVWGGWRKQSEPEEAAVQYWETEETIENYAAEDFGEPMTVDAPNESTPRWWSRVLPSTFLFWPLATKDAQASRQHQAWNVEVLPEHYEICFNFLRHLFDLLVVGFLWTVSPPVKAILEMAGLQGALKLWVHGMVLFLVSTVGMAGILWLIQEYLPQFALVYGIVQALVISVSVRQSVILGEEEEERAEERVPPEMWINIRVTGYGQEPHEDSSFETICTESKTSTEISTVVLNEKHPHAFSPVKGISQTMLLGVVLFLAAFFT
ncbi:hypothetical protein GJAV_G00105660 [Gymnothorax javanicus]|nr:hypothetical protein GJAV_G00105660 [Gymnothorax javanicus]